MRVGTRIKELCAALEIDEYVTAKDGDAAKLKQLQTLLKSLS